MNHVVIIGFMGSGKTRVGKQLSKDLGLPFVDLEKIITKRMNLSAREIFERFGEPYYRALETLALKQTDSGFRAQGDFTWSRSSTAGTERKIISENLVQLFI